jgi:uncharacterized membrane protein YbhN (UPF0104 family)
MPAIDDALAIAAAVFAVAAWVVPPIRYLLSFRKKPRDSLAVVGRVIGLFVLAAMLSAAGLALGIVTLVFTERDFWGWFSIGLIGAYWLALAASLLISDLFRRGRRQDGKQL